MSKTVGVTPGAFSTSFHHICEILSVESVVLDKPTLVENLDLVILTGGADINPALYGQENTHSYINAYSMQRDIYEIHVLNYARKLGKKILGVCRGHQLINAVLGGTLVQEIGMMVRHGGHHDLTDKEGVISHFFDRVNSMHHQGVLVPGVGLTPTSRYGGVIESTEGKDILSVQWHPEAMGKQALEFFNHIIKEWE